MLAIGITIVGVAISSCSQERLPKVSPRVSDRN